MIEVIENYRVLRNTLGNMINKSGYKGSFIAEKIGILPDNFYVKKKRGN